MLKLNQIKNWNTHTCLSHIYITHNNKFSVDKKKKKKVLRFYFW